MSMDIDIDFPEPRQVIDSLRCVQAREENGRRHQSGVYFQDIPINPLDGLAVWDFRTAAKKGYFKVDCLSNSIYKGVRDEAHLVALATREPPWEMFEDSATVSRLKQIGKPKHLPVLQKIKPRTIEDLALCLALIRPAKRLLKDKSRAEIEAAIWTPTEEEGAYAFKRSHAIAFATSLVVQLNLMLETDG